MKVKIVGNEKRLILWFLLCSSFLHATELTLSISSLNGERLKQAGVGVPFLVEVTAQGAQAETKTGSLFFSRSATPEIKNLDKFNGRFVGSSMNMINGVGSMTYRYRARIDKPGGYHIGPATLEYNQEKISSAKIEFTVGDQEVFLVQRSQEKKNQSVFLGASINRKKIMLGEKIVYTLRYYYLDRTTQLRAIVPPKFNSFTVGKPTGPLEGQEQLNGHTYSYAQWQWDLYPTQDGMLTIPAAAAEIDVLDTRAMSILSFLGGATEQKQIFSPALTLHVDALPAYHEKVDAIGSFNAIYAKTDQTTVKEGEGFVYTLELVGDGNIEQIPVPVLKKIPESIKWYDSKNYMVDTPAGSTRKRKFEYIMQGLQPGTFQIPAQVFTYFDSEKRAYKTRETSAINIKVNQTALSKKHTSSQEKFSKIHPSKKETHTLLPLAPVDRMNIYVQWDMPIWLFITLLFILCAVPGIVLFLPLIRASNTYKKRRGKRNIFDRARVELKKIEHEKTYEKIYRIFIETCAAQWGIAENTLPEKTNDYLKTAGFDGEKIEQFDEFMTLLAGMAYAQIHQADMGKKIVEQAYMWLDELEKKS